MRKVREFAAAWALCALGLVACEHDYDEKPQPTFDPKVHVTLNSAGDLLTITCDDGGTIPDSCRSDNKGEGSLKRGAGGSYWEVPCDKDTKTITIHTLGPTEQKTIEKKKIG